MQQRRPVCSHARMKQENGQIVCLDCGELLGASPPTPAFADRSASVLWCASCQQTRPVRLEGETYHCAVCGAEVGTKITTATTASSNDSPVEDEYDEGGI
jgi:hypothetical protein